MKKLLLLITFTFILFFFLLTTPCNAKQMNILVYPFQNTGDTQYSWISAGMTDTVISDLNRIKGLSVVAEKDRKDALKEIELTQSGLISEETMVKVGRLIGADIVFTGSYLVSGNRIRVNARLIKVETGKTESSTKIDGALDGIFDLQDKVVFTLMGETEKITLADIKPVKLTEQDKKNIEEKPRPSITAYEWYAKGLEAQDNNPKEALNNFKKAIDIDPNYTDALKSAGFIAGVTLNLFSEALGYLEKAERIFDGRNETKSSSYAMLMNNTGTVYASKGQLDRALEYYLKGKSIRDRLRLQNTAGYAMLMNNIGLVYRGKGQLDRALEYFLNSQTLWDRLGLQNTANYAMLMLNIGVVYQSKGQFDRALEYYLNSQSIRDRLGLQNTTGYAVLTMNIGLVYWDKGQVERALEYYLNSQSINDRLGLQNTANYAMLVNNIGLVYWKKGQLDRALEYYLNSQSIRDRLRLQNTAGYAMLVMNIGLVYQSKGQLDRALEYYLNSQSINDRLGLQNTAGYAIIIYNLALLYEKKGQSDMAGRYYRMAYDKFVRADYSGEWKDKALNNARRLGY